MNPEILIDINDMQTRRSVSELDIWIKEQCEKFTATPETKAYLRGHQGLTKQLLEEVLPIARYTQAKYGLNSDVGITPVIGNQKYDALITTESEIYKVEATLACDGYEEHHRMQILQIEGHVPAWGKIEVSGTKHTGHKYKVHSSGVSNLQIYRSIINNILNAYRQKVSMSYKNVRHLIIGFGDNLGFGELDDVEVFRSMLSKLSGAHKGSFKGIWIVGNSGNFHAEY